MDNECTVFCATGPSNAFPPFFFLLFFFVPMGECSLEVAAGDLTIMHSHISFFLSYYYLFVIIII